MIESAVLLGPIWWRPCGILTDCGMAAELEVRGGWEVDGREVVSGGLEGKLEGGLGGGLGGCLRIGVGNVPMDGPGGASDFVPER